MAVKVKFEWKKPVDRIMSDAGIDRSAVLYAAKMWHSLYAPFVPTDTGRLRDNVTYSAEGTKAVIRHNEPYAAEQYTKAKGGGGKNPLATAYWDKAAEAAGKRAELAGAMRAYLKRG